MRFIFLGIFWFVYKLNKILSKFILDMQGKQFQNLLGVTKYN